MAKDLQEIAEHYDRLAAESRDRVKWNQQMGIDPPQEGPGISIAGLEKARTFEAAARAKRMQMEDGIARCVCHLIPMTECRQRAIRR